MPLVEVTGCEYLAETRFLVRDLFPSRSVLCCCLAASGTYADWMADAIVSENRLRSASKGGASADPGISSAPYRPKQEDPTGRGYY